MKSIKILAAALVLVAGIAASAFTPATRTATDFRFDPNQVSGAYKRQIQLSQTLSIVPSEMENSAKWGFGLPSVTYASTGAYLRAVSFVFDEDGTDGGSDGELSLQEAISGVEDYYTLNSTLPQDGQTITVLGVAVTIKRSDSNIN